MLMARGDASRWRRVWHEGGIGTRSG
jgi:hypothetical protein